MRSTVLLQALFALCAAAFLSLETAQAASKEKIDWRVKEALDDFRREIDGAQSVLARSKGTLVFPSVKKGGFGIGGEYGEGALLIGDATAAYYSTASASIGFQIGLQARRQIIVFLDENALEKFRYSDGWEVGVDASVAVVTVGAGGAIDATKINQPIVAFIFDHKGLMYNLSLEGTKITEIHDD